MGVKHGMILKNDDLGLRPQSDPFSLDDPMTVLMEFMRIRNLRLIDLFACLDKDGNKSLSREEFRDGLMVSYQVSNNAPPLKNVKYHVICIYVLQTTYLCNIIISGILFWYKASLN